MPVRLCLVMSIRLAGDFACHFVITYQDLTEQGFFPSSILRRPELGVYTRPVPATSHGCWTTSYLQHADV